MKNKIPYECWNYIQISHTDGHIRVASYYGKINFNLLWHWMILWRLVMLINEEKEHHATWYWWRYWAHIYNTIEKAYGNMKNQKLG